MYRTPKYMAYNIREKCSAPGCNRMGRNKGNYKGNTIYGHECDIHHKLKYNMETDILLKQMIDNSKCEICGWDKAPCDRHRIIPEIGYVKENVRVLCPNCHREQHFANLKGEERKL